MKSRFLDWRKNARPTMDAIDPSSTDRTMRAAEFQTATGRVQFAVSDGMRASKYQTSQYEELQRMLAAMSQPSDSPTSAVAEMRQKPIRGSMARMSNIGMIP
jgi:hypothetical protein